jgi:hypothetical protein
MTRNYQGKKEVFKRDEMKQGTALNQNDTKVSKEMK